MERATADGLRVAVGERIPSVGLRATDGYLLNLQSFVTKQPACFFFFGAPTLSGSERERGDALASAFARGYQRLTDAGVAVVGITCDSEQQQTDYATSRRLPYLLFSDERRTAVELLGVPTTHTGDNYNATRAVIAVDEAGVIRLVSLDPDPERVVDDVLFSLSGEQPQTPAA